MQRQDFKKTDDMFNRVLGKDHIAVVCLFENIHTGTRVVVSNAHIHWDPAFSDVKVVQAALLVEEVEKMTNNFAKYPPPILNGVTPSKADSTALSSELDGINSADGSSAHSSPPSQAYRQPPIYTDGTKIPLIIAGDYNSVPSSGVYEFITNGTLAPNHPDFLSHTYGRYTSDGVRHRLGLKSAYAGVPEDVVPMTNYIPSFKGEIDYIFYSAGNLAVNKVLTGVDKGYLSKVVGFPNAHFPSEYVLFSLFFKDESTHAGSAATYLSPPNSASNHLGILDNPQRLS